MAGSARLDMLLQRRQQSRAWDIAAVYRLDVMGGSLQFDAQAENSSGITAETLQDKTGEFGQPEWVGRLVFSNMIPWGVGYS